ncbi:MAG: acetyltransferase [Candidatus Hodarchaeales archaeon]|jgi:sugar O-acyltransferase (sialic acid O-acetyltransferase NeuD family)
MENKDLESTKKIIIIGTGGNCVDILDIIKDINKALKVPKYKCIGFLDDNESMWNKLIFGIKVLGSLDSASQYKDSYFVNGIGSPQNFWKKQKIISTTNISEKRFETIIHPSASVSTTAEIGKGTVIFQNVTINSNVKVGENVIILPNTVISHNDKIGDYTCIASGVCVSGNVSIGQSCYLGTNSAIIGKVNIGNYSLIGMGSVVLNDVSENSIFIGNPAKFIRHTIP